jgi:ABC-2 type transport system permease protein
MIGLIQNELIKIFSKAASWVYMLFIIAALCVGAYFYSNFSEPANENWREELTTTIEHQQRELANPELPEEEKQYIQEDLEQNQQFLDKNINPNAKSSWHFMNDVVIAIGSLVTLFSVIICSSNVSSEFGEGTIKQLLIRPYKRWQILLSKYLAVTIYSFLLVVVLVVSGYLIGLMLFGSGNFSQTFFEYTMDGRVEAVIGEQFLLKLIYYIPSLLMVTAISFMLSTLFKKESLAVGVGIFVLFFSSSIGGILIFFAEKYPWTKLLIFPHLELGVYAIQSEILPGVTLPFSLAVLAVYYIIFMALTFRYFQKRDIGI